MSKTIPTLLLVCLSLAVGLRAQTTTVQLSTGAGYAKSAYFKLSDGSSQQVAHDAWDIAFSNLGTAYAGIFVNESTATVNGQPTVALEAYDPYVFDFSETIDPDALLPEQLLLNPEHSWAEGAFNAGIDSSNTNDYGWGAYDPTAKKVIGYRVFVLKLRDGSYRKISFDEYDGNAYTFRAANLDGTNLSTHTVNTAFGNGSPLIYFSFGTNGANVPTATGWDLVFCRYLAALSDGQGGFVPYAVTGVLTADGMQTAKATAVDPATVDHTPYLDSLSHRLDIIGHDWKFFNLQTGWVVLGDRAYFVKTQDNLLYKLVWVGFSGSASGTATLQRTLIGQLSATADLPSEIASALVYPNPATDQIHLAVSASKNEQAKIRLLDGSGRLVWSGLPATLQAGLTVLDLPLPALPAGTYWLQVQTPGGQFVRQLVLGR
ncbi:MAG: T9SS type A sorting domain-containing protein [Saprospiraceae bacterium]|nr:T9SS type A sorting domain-containing protein [Saprospiraceae bacterium]